MNNSWKSLRKNSSETPLVAKKKPASPNPRNPLRDLSNGGGSGSAAAPSTKASSSSIRGNASPRATLARSKSQPKTPQSTHSSGAVPSRVDRQSSMPSRAPSRSNLDCRKQLAETKFTRARSPTSAPDAKARRPKSSNFAPIQNRGSFGRIVPRSNAGELGGGIGLRRDPSKTRAFVDSTPHKPVRTRGMGVGKARSLTAAAAASSAPNSQSTPGKAGDKRHSTTPVPTATTPPIQASISPEIVCGPSVQPTPACFAAGHRIAGLPDRRKCKPRGILKVSDGDAVKIVDIFRSDDAPGECSPQTTVVTPPLAKASMQWLSSPSAGPIGNHSEGSYSSSGVRVGELRAEASVDWLLASPFDGDSADHCDGIQERNRYDCETTTPISNCTPALGTPDDSSPSNLETTPSSVVGVCKTPSTNSSISPFSMILKKATDIKSLRPKPEARKRNHGSEMLHPPTAEGSSNDDDTMVSNQPTYSGSNKQLPSMLMSLEEENLEDVEIIGSSSPERKVIEGLSQSSLFISQSFQFGCTASSSNSVDLTQFYKTPRFHRIAASQLQSRGREEGSSSESESRISWREGLLSRIFDDGELSSCLKEDENEEIGCDEEVLLTSDQNSKVSVSEPVDANGFGSFEYVHDRRLDDGEYNDNDQRKFVPLAESMIIETERLVSSSESDWRMLFENHLFQV